MNTYLQFLTSVLNNADPIERNLQNVAIWEYKNAYSRRVPIQSYINGKWVTTGYRNEQVNHHCQYKTALSNDKVVDGNYEGTGCGFLSPKVK